ncbi:MAG: biotin--[acetyl-CoA-carboxylase] ligase, partial [archaeon GB-1867-035]|nr:biotin--[acetyl-CoA-carboxylase] ligase [Candidatus Culexmicrobium profundum]
VRKAINEICKIDVKVKWPNDIVINSKKLGGIICEAILAGEKLEYLIVGIGINVNIEHRQFPSQLKKQATSILIVTGRKFKIESILNEIIKNLDAYKKLIENNLEEKILNEWRKHDIILGRKVKVSNREKIVGYAVDIKDDGALILRRNDGKIVELYAEDIKIEM